MAMFLFLEDFYFRTKSDDVGALLGGMRILRSGSSFDPAYLDDWKKAVNKALIRVSSEDELL